MRFQTPSSYASGAWRSKWNEPFGPAIRQCCKSRVGAVNVVAVSSKEAGALSELLAQESPRLQVASRIKVSFECLGKSLGMLDKVPRSAWLPIR
jgi:hypothetical protein